LHTPPSRARARDEEGDATPASLFEVKSIHTKVDSLKFSIRNSKHDFLYKTIKPLATGLIKRQIQRAIRDLLMNGMEYLDTQLVSMKEKMEVTEAGEGEGGKTRTEALRSVRFPSFLIISPFGLNHRFYRCSRRGKRKLLRSVVAQLKHKQKRKGRNHVSSRL
jgi:hypothetical protein